MHLSAHGYVHENGYRDIWQLLDHERPFPWDRFVARARQFRLTVVCYFVLDALASVPDVPNPPTCWTALRPPAWQRRLVPFIADPRAGWPADLTYSKPRSYLLHLALANRPADVLRVMVWLFFPGSRGWRNGIGYRPLAAVAGLPVAPVGGPCAGAVGLGAKS